MRALLVAAVLAVAIVWLTMTGSSRSRWSGTRGASVLMDYARSGWAIDSWF